MSKKEARGQFLKEARGRIPRLGRATQKGAIAYLPQWRLGERVFRGLRPFAPQRVWSRWLLLGFAREPLFLRYAEPLAPGVVEAFHVGFSWNAGSRQGLHAGIITARSPMPHWNSHFLSLVINRGSRIVGSDPSPEPDVAEKDYGLGSSLELRTRRLRAKLAILMESVTPIQVPAVFVIRSVTPE